MFRYELDVKNFIASMSDIEKRSLPLAAARALNVTMFAVRDDWRKEMSRVFDRPTPFTLASVRFNSATKEHLVAEVYIRDEAGKGTPPSKYLQPEVAGGFRHRKASEIALNTKFGFRKFYVPGHGVALDQYGNISAGLIVKILSQLQASRNVDARETVLKRGRRLKRQRRKGGGGSYFMLSRDRGKLKAGVVYERVAGAEIGETGPHLTSRVRSILYGISTPPQYRSLFHSEQIARDQFNRTFPQEFIDQLKVAILTGRR
jgi:hypothetical protein